jgi:hypothetical protein
MAVRRGGNPKYVYVGNYSHCSCYGADTAVQEQFEKDTPKFAWEGLIDVFMRDHVLPQHDIVVKDRPLDPEDYDYEGTIAFYAACRKWYKTSTCPAALVDVDLEGRKILRLPRLYAHVHEVDHTALTANQLRKLGTYVSRRVSPTGKCTVNGVPTPINMYEPDQYAALVCAIKNIKLNK